MSPTPLEARRWVVPKQSALASDYASLAVGSSAGAGGREASRRYLLRRSHHPGRRAAGLLCGGGQLRGAVSLVAGLVWVEHVAALPVVNGLDLRVAAAVVSLQGVAVKNDFRSQGLCQMVLFSKFACDNLTMPQS